MNSLVNASPSKLPEERGGANSSTSTVRDPQGSPVGEPVDEYFNVNHEEGSCLDSRDISFCAVVQGAKIDNPTPLRPAAPTPLREYHAIIPIARDLLGAINHYATPTHFRFGSRELNFTHFSMHHYQAEYPYRTNPELFEIVIDLSTIFDENTKDIVLNSCSTDDSFGIEIQGKNRTKEVIASESSARISTIYSKVDASYQSFALPESQAKVSFTLKLLPGIKINKKIAAEIIKYNEKHCLVIHAPLCIKPLTVTYVDFTEELRRMGRKHP